MRSLIATSTIFFALWLSLFLIIFQKHSSKATVTDELLRHDRQKMESCRSLLRKRALLRPKPTFIPKPDIQSYTVQTNIKYRYATTVIHSRVANPADISQEINFGVTIPEQAFISQFLMVIKDKVYKADVKEKDEAKEVYAEAKESGQTAGQVKLSDRDSNRFAVSINVEAKGNVAFNLTYEQLLQRTSGVYENHVHINPGQVIDLLDVTVNIQESSSLTTLNVLNYNGDSAESYTLVDNKNAIVFRQGNKAADIQWNPTRSEQEAISDNGMKGLLVVRYDIDRQTKTNEILVERNYFAHFIAPNNLKKLSKYVIFVIDISGSMTPKKLNQLKTAMDPILSEIKEGDYFSFVLFSREILLWSLNGITQIPSSNDISKSISGDETKFLIEATDSNIYAAIDFINNLEARTSTNIINALRSGIELAKLGREKHPENEPIMFFLSDGDANIEETNPDVIIKNINALNSNIKCSIFSLAFGGDANFKFLDTLSKSNGGFAKNIYLASDTAMQLTEFYKQISSPLMSEIAVRYDPALVNISTVSKTNFSNYFDGSELVVAGKVSNDNHDRQFDLHFDANYKTCDGCDPISNIEKIVVDGKSSSDSGPLERLWAYTRVKQLLDEDAVNGTIVNSSFKEEALALSLKYSFVTPLTSLVVVKPNETTYTNVDSIGRKGLRKSSHVMIRPSTASSTPTSDLGNSYEVNSETTKRSRPAPTMSQINPYDPLGNKTPQNIGVRQVIINSLDNNVSENKQSSSTTVRSRPPTTKRNEYSIHDLTWLDNTVDQLTLPQSKYIVETNVPDLSHGSCTTLTGIRGFCKHIVHCLFAEILDDLHSYLPYRCVIQDKYAGVCCPENMERLLG